MAKNEVVQLRCTPIEKDRWNQAAAANGQELSPWIRHILNQAVTVAHANTTVWAPADPLFDDPKENE